MADDGKNTQPLENVAKNITCLGVQLFFIFSFSPPIWGRFPIWLRFSKNWPGWNHLASPSKGQRIGTENNPHRLCTCGWRLPLQNATGTGKCQKLRLSWMLLNFGWYRVQSNISVFSLLAVGSGCDYRNWKHDVLSFILCQQKWIFRKNDRIDSNLRHSLPPSQHFLLATTKIPS